MFLLGFAAASLILLTGFENPDVKNMPLTKKQAAFVGVKKSQPQKSKKKRTKPALIPSVIESAELQKSLDLSVPFKIPENAWLKTEQNKMPLMESLNMFTTEKKKKPQPLYLDSQMIMSQEPENDKKKSLDGAGIVINLKR